LDGSGSPRQALLRLARRGQAAWAPAVPGETTGETW